MNPQLAFHCPTTFLFTQFLFTLFANVIESFKRFYISLWFGDNAVEMCLPSIFLNVLNLNRRLKSKITRLMDSSPFSNIISQMHPIIALRNLTESLHSQ